MGCLIPESREDLQEELLGIKARVFISRVTALAAGGKNGQGEN